MTDDELFYWRAWEEMGSDRPASMGGMLPIPLTAIISFADYADLSPRETDYLVQVTRAVDNRMLVLIAEKRAKKQSKTTIE